MIGTLIASLASGEIVLALGRARRAAVAYAFVAIAAILGLGFLLGAAVIAVARHYTPLQTALGFGIGFLLLALVIFALHRVSSGVRVRRATRTRSVETKRVASAAAVALLPLIVQRVGFKGLLLPLAGLAALMIMRENSNRDPDKDRD